jgi:hypothetical protein
MINDSQHAGCREVGFEIASFLKQVCHGDTRTSRSDSFESAPTQHFVDNGMPLFVGKGATKVLLPACGPGGLSLARNRPERGSITLTGLLPTNRPCSGNPLANAIARNGALDYVKFESGGPPASVCLSQRGWPSVGLSEARGRKTHPAALSWKTHP